MLEWPYMTVRTRLAPSPTGWFHLGNIRTYLYDYALARRHNGQVVIRLEDTDQKRLVEGAEAKIYEMITAYGMDWDEGPDKGGPYPPYRQSEKLPKYKEAAQFLVKNDFAYYAFDTEEYLEKVREDQRKKGEVTHYDKKDRFIDPSEAQKRVDSGEPHVVRLKLPEGTTFSYKDPILGKEVSWESKDLDDIILLKSDGFPTYHLGVVVDDIDMKITHVIRGQEWIASTPYHVFLYDAFKYPRPEICHVTVIVDPRTGKKFSKRDMTQLFSAEKALVDGYLPEAVLNYLMLLGWAPKDNREVFTLKEFVEVFDLSGLQKANPIYSMDKMHWFAGYYIRNTSDSELYQKLIAWINKYHSSEFDFVVKLPKQRVLKCLPLIKERSTTLRELAELIKQFYVDPSVYEISNAKGLKDKAKEDLKKPVQLLIGLVESLSSDSSSWEHASWEQLVRSVSKDSGWKDADTFMLLRVGICGKPISPPLFELMQVAGKEVCLCRLRAFLENLSL